MKGYVDQDQLWLSVFATAFVQQHTVASQLGALRSPQLDQITVHAEAVANAALESFRRVHKFGGLGSE